MLAGVKVVELQALALGVLLLTHTMVATAATHKAARCAQPDL